MNTLDTLDLFGTTSFVLVYENEEGGEDNKGDGDGGGDDKGDQKPKTFTQEEVNKIMATNRRSLTQQNDKLVTELTTLKDQANLTTQEKSELEDRIEKLQEQSMTKEEVAKRTNTKAAKKHEEAIGIITKDRNAWQERYTKERVVTELTSAAIIAKSVPEQIVMLLGSDTYLSPQLGDDGQPNGSYDTLVKFNDVAEDGQPVTLNLAPEAALKRMKELPDRFGNLFLNPGAGGMGGNSGSNSGSGAQQTVESLKDTNNYMAWRAKNPGKDPTEFKG